MLKIISHEDVTFILPGKNGKIITYSEERRHILLNISC